MATKILPQKCFSLTIGKQDEQEFNYHMMIDNVIHANIKTGEIKDIGVTIDCRLRFEKHVNRKIETANKLVGILRRSFMFLDEETFVPLFKALVRSHFDYTINGCMESTCI